jgi:hypothetical protein
MFISGSQLNATVPSADTAAASVTVFNPTPGGGASDVIFFPVHAPVTSLERPFRPPSARVQRADFFFSASLGKGFVACGGGGGGAIGLIP